MRFGACQPIPVKFVFSGQLLASVHSEARLTILLCIITTLFTTYRSISENLIGIIKIYFPCPTNLFPTFLSSSHYYEGAWKSLEGRGKKPEGNSYFYIEKWTFKIMCEVCYTRAQVSNHPISKVLQWLPRYTEFLKGYGWGYILVLWERFCYTPWL